MTITVTDAMCKTLTNELVLRAAATLTKASHALPAGPLSAECAGDAIALMEAAGARAAHKMGSAPGPGRPGRWYRLGDPNGERQFVRGVPAVAALVGRKAGSLNSLLATTPNWTSCKDGPGWSVRLATDAEVAKLEAGTTDAT